MKRLPGIQIRYHNKLEGRSDTLWGITRQLKSLFLKDRGLSRINCSTQPITNSPIAQSVVVRGQNLLEATRNSQSS